MSGDERDPPRLLDEGGSEGELRSLMRAGKSEVPNEAQMLALAAKLGVLGGLGGAGAAGGAGGAAGAGGAGAAVKAGLAMKVIAAIAVIGVASGGVAIAVKKSGESTAAPVGLVATSTTSASPVAIATASAGPSEIPSPVPSESASAIPARVASAAARPPESPEAEVKLLGRAQDALRSRPDEALALCGEHARRFPAGGLVQEREVIAIEALVKTGRSDEARARADRFKARFPGSTHTRRIETILASGTRLP
jgi:hypothetical protein